MSYEPALLLAAIEEELSAHPCALLKELATQLHVSPRTLERIVAANSGRRFRDLRQEALVAKVRELVRKEPRISVKELSSATGFTSARSFARAIRRSCGVSPEGLRRRVAEQIMQEKPQSARAGST